MSLAQLILQGDGVSRAVTLLLLAMSVSSWVVIVWKSWLLHRATGDVLRSVAAFWQSVTVDEALVKLKAFDPLALVYPMVSATKLEANGTLASAGDRSQQLTRVLRDALHAALAKLHYGQVLLATVGATAPVVGLLGAGGGCSASARGLRWGGRGAVA